MTAQQWRGCDDVLSQIRVHFAAVLSKPLSKNIAVVVSALLSLSTSVRGWYGRLTLWGIARAMHSAGTVKARRKRLGRLLGNAHFKLDAALAGLLSFTGIMRWDGLVPVLIDQTSLCKDAVWAIVASFVHQKRSVPFDLCTFSATGIKASQNRLEWDFLRDLLRRLRGSLTPVLVMDRGYAKVCHLAELINQHALFIIRGCRTVIVDYHTETGSHRCALGRLPHRQGVARRYRNVKYRSDGVAAVDIVVFHGWGHAEPWFLILPPCSEQILPTQKVVEWYRRRMRIETTFRDFKSWLGVRRGLHLVIDQPVRMGRIMICVALTYMIVLAVGASAAAARLRQRTEVRRRKARHGTRSTLSIFTVAVLTLEAALRTAPLPEVLWSLLGPLSADGLFAVPSPGD